MKVLVTGAAGFIGFHLCLALLKRGDQVTGLDNINDYYDPSLKIDRLKQLGISEAVPGKKVTSGSFPEFDFIRIGLDEKDQLFSLFKENNFDAVINLAAQVGVRYSLVNPDAYIPANIAGFLNILEACRNFPVKHLVYASTSSVYGSNTDMPFSEHQPTNHPVSLYAATKKANELMAHSYSHLYNIPTTGLRFFTVYGPWGRPDMALFLFTKAIINGEPIKVFNEGKMQRDFTYVEDIVQGIVKVLDNPASPNPDWKGVKPDPATSYAPYRVYNIGNNKPAELIEFIEAIEAELGKKGIKEFLPMQAGDVPATHADITNLMADTGYSPQFSVQQGVKYFVTWYKDYFQVR
ncbi:MAG: NAD-dependent epimerase [Chitinophagaceae bacterium]|nr:NAD-dependent epimerase [Chitinophagaceae bacterium]